MTATLEDLDIADVLAQRYADTPLWNDLLAEYDAEVINAIGIGWPPVMTVPDEPDSAPQPDEQPPAEDTPSPEPGEQPDAPEPKPAQVEPNPVVPSDPTEDR